MHRSDSHTGMSVASERFSYFAVPVGQAAHTSVDVACTVPLADLIVPGWPGELQVTASAESVLDRYRARS